MQVRAEFALLALAFHRRHDLVTDDEAADICATGFLDELLGEDVGLQAHEGLDHTFCGFVGLCQHHADTLGALEQLDDQGRPPDHVDEVADVIRRMREAGHGQTDALAREQLQRAQLVTRAADRHRLVGRVDVHHLELAQYGGTVKGHRCADTRDHGIEPCQILTLVVDTWAVRGDVHVAAQHVEDADFVPTCLGRLDQAARRIQFRIARENGDVHGLLLSLFLHVVVIPGVGIATPPRSGPFRPHTPGRPPGSGWQPAPGPGTGASLRR